VDTYHARADARNSEATPTFTVLSTPANDRSWWADEALRAGTDWSGVIEAALEMIVVAGIVEREVVAMTPWDAPSWRQAAVEYHRDRPGRLAGEIDPTRLALLRRLMVPDISLERAWHELRDMRPNFRKAISDDR
jgi:hypothetical protein